MALKDGVDWSPRIALYGDLGSVDAKSLSSLQQEVQRGQLDAILHVGGYYMYALLRVFLYSLLRVCTLYVQCPLRLHITCKSQIPIDEQLRLE